MFVFHAGKRLLVDWVPSKVGKETAAFLTLSQDGLTKRRRKFWLASAVQAGCVGGGRWLIGVGAHTVF